MNYFIQQGTDGPIKIGYTDIGVRMRLTQLQTGNPEKLNLLLELPGSLEDEELLHQRFENYRIRGEWFHPAHTLLQFIEKADALAERAIVQPPRSRTRSKYSWWKRWKHTERQINAIHKQVGKYFDRA